MSRRALRGSRLVWRTSVSGSSGESLLTRGNVSGPGPDVAQDHEISALVVDRLPRQPGVSSSTSRVIVAAILPRAYGFIVGPFGSAGCLSTGGIDPSSSRPGSRGMSVAS